MKKIEPVAYARKWHIDKEEPYKVRREKDNRLVWHRKFIFHAITDAKIFKDDVPLWTDEAMQAVAKAVYGKVGADLIHHLSDEGFQILRNIDIAAIINQLKGE